MQLKNKMHHPEKNEGLDEADKEEEEEEEERMFKRVKRIWIKGDGCSKLVMVRHI